MQNLLSFFQQKISVYLVIKLYLQVICQEKCKNVNFRYSDKRYQENHTAENHDKKTCAGGGL